MLKMLTLPALQNWRSKERSKVADHLVEDLDYVAIYVPSDFTWYPEFRRPIKVRPSKEVDEVLSYALFRNHVLLAICDTLAEMRSPQLQKDKYLKRFSIDSDEATADRLSKLLKVYSWEISIPIGGFYGLKKAVSGRIRTIQHLLTLAATQPTSVSTLLEKNKFLTATFFDDLRDFADSFEAIYGRNFRWALCFDEVEIAPDPVKKPIWQSGQII